MSACFPSLPLNRPDISLPAPSSRPLDAPNVSPRFHRSLCPGIVRHHSPRHRIRRRPSTRLGKRAHQAQTGTARFQWRGSGTQGLKGGIDRVRSFFIVGCTRLGSWQEYKRWSTAPMPTFVPLPSEVVRQSTTLQAATAPGPHPVVRAPPSTAYETDPQSSR